ncbi:CHAT domain-containing protein [Streptomyces sp. NPDC051976]|uniref:CHAT domain-containing protein n=1 Tax=Streptomyces sp. NPDC051976 TaxID=3154947 RepID=UPI00342CABAA
MAEEAGSRSDERAGETGLSNGQEGLIVPITWVCPACGLDATAPVWVFLDVEQRPDLWPTASTAMVCPGCADPAPEQPSLLVAGTPSGIALLVARGTAPDDPCVIRVCMLNHRPPEGFDSLRPHSPLIHVSRADAEPMLCSDDLPPLHARALDEALAVRSVQEALLAALSSTSADQLAEATDAHPELLGPAVLMEWREHSIGENAAGGTSTPAQTTMDQLPDMLLDELSRVGATEAWQRYSEHVAEAVAAFGGELEHEISDLLAASDRGEASRTMADRCMQLATGLLSEIAPGRAALMWFTRGVTLISPLMSAPGDIEDAIEAFEQAINQAEAADDPIAVAQARSNLVIALHMRPRDRELSLERGIGLLKELVVFWDGLPEPNTAALVRTNLAVSLLDRKAGDLLENASRALAECQTALLHRSRERNPVDYAFTVTNMAVAHSRLAELDESHLVAAERSYEEALDVLPPDSDAALLGRIFYNYTDLLVTTSRRQPKAREEFLSRAEACARRAVLVHQEHAHTQELAFARRQLARILSYGAEDDPIGSAWQEARDLLFQSLEVLTPDAYPADCLTTADETTALCQDMDDWHGASLASLMALVAWRASGGDTVGRENFPSTPEERDPALTELAHDSRFRFTAYRLFRAARQQMEQGSALTSLEVQTVLEQAVGIMEAGRATTLRAASGAEVGELQRLRGLDPGLAEAYLSAVAKARGAAHAEAFASADAGYEANDLRADDEVRPSASKDRAGSSLEDLLTTIRSLPTLSDFAKGQSPSVREVASALEPGQAVIYLIAAPAGCCALVVTPQSSLSGVVPVDLSSTNSGRLLTLILGVGKRPDGSPDGLTPGRPRAGEALVIGLSEFHFPRFRRVLSKVLAEIGRTVAQPLAHELANSGVSDAIVVPCGLLPAFAWHAASWRDHRGPMSLVDVLNTVSYAPSAGAWMAARKRAARLTEGPPFLVGLANPSRSQPKLPGAEMELRHLVTYYPAGRSSVAYGADATGGFLLGQLPHATHLHLGCHGTMRYDSVDGAYLTLADGEHLDLTRIRRLMGDELRLVVVAACVSGAVNVILQPEESHALTIGFMHAGAAGVLGALWPIPDVPTALFITRFYEELTQSPGAEPAIALASTQRWMRTLTSAAIHRYVAERPALTALRGLGRLRGAVPAPDPRRAHLANMRANLRKRPFATPEYWAAFVLNGC